MPYADPERRREYAADWKRQNVKGQSARERRAEYVNEQKSKPCTDCGGVFPPYVMHFDHIGTDKVASVSRILRNQGLAALKAEIAKCELVCSNCHHIRTYTRYHQ